MGLIRRLFTVMGVLLLASVGLATYLWLTDYPVDGTVTGKSAPDASPTHIVVTTKIGGIDITKEVPPEQWAVLQEGNFVQYHIQSGKTLVYEREGGSLIYSSG